MFGYQSSLMTIKKFMPIQVERKMWLKWETWEGCLKGCLISYFKANFKGYLMVFCYISKAKPKADFINFYKNLGF